MRIEKHYIKDIHIAELIADCIIIQKNEDGLDLLGNLYYHGFDKVIIHEKNITSNFFDLKNKMAGEILQKFSNYRVRLAIVGDFSKYTRKSIKDFNLINIAHFQWYSMRHRHHYMRTYVSTFLLSFQRCVQT